MTLNTSGHAHIPPTKNARQQLEIDLLTRGEVRSQGELGELLADNGVVVTQATLSRDLVELDAVKVRSASGALVYAVPAEGGDRSCSSPPRRAPTSSYSAPLPAPPTSWPPHWTRPSSVTCSAPSPATTPWW
jgi:transcriptional regulator of arginine metabolism